MINLSMTLIRNYLDCPQKLAYSSGKKDPSQQTDEMLEGIIVHQALEDGWTSKGMAKSIVKRLTQESGRSNLDEKKMDKCVDNFFLQYSHQLSAKDVIEGYFKQSYTKGVTIVGKFDRIHNGVVYDWKTGDRPPEDLNRDVQFMFYYLAYKKVYKKEPSALIYASLSNKKSYLFEPIPGILSEFENELIPAVIAEARKSTHVRSGFYKYGVCKKCPFKSSCWEE